STQDRAADNSFGSKYGRLPVPPTVGPAAIGLSVPVGITSGPRLTPAGNTQCCATAGMIVSARSCGLAILQPRRAGRRHRSSLDGGNGKSLFVSERLRYFSPTGRILRCIPQWLPREGSGHPWG